MHATITSYTARRYAQQLVYGLAPLLLLLAGASSAVAASCVPSADVYTVDTKVFPATMCRQIGSTNTVYYDGHRAAPQSVDDGRGNRDLSHCARRKPRQVGRPCTSWWRIVIRMRTLPVRHAVTRRMGSGGHLGLRTPSPQGSMTSMRGRPRR